MSALALLPRPRLLVTTPVHLRAMVSSTVDAVPADIVLSATAPLADELAQQAEAYFGAPVMEIFGSTESGQTATRRTLNGDLWTPMPGVRFFAGDDNKFFADSHIDDAIELADRLEIEDDGRFKLVGRQSDMLIVAGKRGSKTFVESQLLGIDGVDDAAVFNDERPNSRGRIIGFVVAPGLARAEILNQLKGRVDSAFVPRPLYFVDRLPRNATGKLTHQALATLAGNAEQDD
jgi:acyl-coenzyme A synthetase/AMP-(fatty) acid ligase